MTIILDDELVQLEASHARGAGSGFEVSDGGGLRNEQALAGASELDAWAGEIGRRVDRGSEVLRSCGERLK